MRKNESDAEGGGYVLPQSETSKLHEQLLAEVGTAWLGLVRAVSGMRAEGVVVQSITIRGEWGGADDILVVITAVSEDGPVVAFHGAEGPTNVWKRLLRRIERGGLKWRHDEYAKQV